MTHNNVDNNLIAFLKEEKWGYMDSNGNIVLKPQFLDAGIFTEEGLAPVCVDNSPEDFILICGIKTPLTFSQIVWGYVNIKGEFVIEPQYQSALPFSKGLAIVTSFHTDYEGNQYQLINASGKSVTKRASYSNFRQFSNGYWIVEYGCSYVGKEYCFYNFEIYDKVGNCIIEGKKFLPNETPSRFSDYIDGVLLATVSSGKKTYVFDEQGELLLTIKFPKTFVAKVNKGFLLEDNGKYGVLNVTGDILVPFEYANLKFINQKNLSPTFFEVAQQ